MSFLFFLFKVEDDNHVYFNQSTFLAVYLCFSFYFYSWYYLSGLPSSGTRMNYWNIGKMTSETRRRVNSMVLMFDGNSELGAHVRSTNCCLICLRHLIRTRTVTNYIVLLQKVLFSFLRAPHVLSYHLKYNGLSTAQIETSPLPQKQLTFPILNGNSLHWNWDDELRGKSAIFYWKSPKIVFCRSLGYKF